jgi:hypothetical protein
VVSRRAHGHEGGGRLAASQRFDRGEAAAGGEQRGVERARRHRCVRVEVSAARVGELLDRVEVRRIVHSDEFAAAGDSTGRPRDVVAEAGILNASDRAVDARRAFGMPASGVVSIVVAERRHQYPHATSRPVTATVSRVSLIRWVRYTARPSGPGTRRPRSGRA